MEKSRIDAAKEGKPAYSEAEDSFPDYPSGTRDVYWTAQEIANAERRVAEFEERRPAMEEREEKLAESREASLMIAIGSWIVAMMLTIRKCKILFSDTPKAIKESIAAKIPKTKKCSYCAEKIKEEAIVCKYCGRDLP